MPLASDDPNRKTLTGAINPEGYRGIFKQGSKNIGQPGESQPGFEGFLKSGTGELAEAYVDRYYEKTGKLPTQGEVEGFVAKNLTPEYVGKYMSGTLGDRARVKSLMVDPYLEMSEITRPDAGGLGGEIGGLKDRLNKIYGDIQSRESEAIRREFAPSRRRAIEEEAAAGRLRSGVSRGPDSAIARTDVNEANALSNLISQLGQSRATGEFSAAQSDADLAENMRQFNKTLGLDRAKFKAAQDQLEIENQNTREGLRLSELLGMMRQEKLWSMNWKK